jgi:hypothetical protein
MNLRVSHAPTDIAMAARIDWAARVLAPMVAGAGRVRDQQDDLGSLLPAS